MITTCFARGLIWTLASSLLLPVSPLVFASIVPAPPAIKARSWILMDYHSGRVLAESNADVRLDPASLTKMMTSYVTGLAIKSGRISHHDTVTVGQNAWATGNPVLKGSSLMFLKPGDMVSVSDLNKGMVIQSGNDASIALAEHIAGSQSAFVALMNNYVGTLGLKNTHFKTVHGLDAAGQYSTARDMALLSQALIRDVPDEYALHKEQEFTFNHIRQYNRNRLLWSANLNVDGIKTGHTSGAGNNLVASATEGNMRLISVVMATGADPVRFRESKRLLTWGFRFFETVTVAKSQQVVTAQRVWFGTRKEVNLGVNTDVILTLPKEQLKNLNVSFSLNQAQLEAPLQRSQQVGVITFMLDNDLIAQHPLVVLNEVPSSHVLSRCIDFIVMKVTGWFSLLFAK